METTSAEEQLIAVIPMLGDPSPQVRIAGVYTLTHIADTHVGHTRQRVVDILCQYLWGVSNFVVGETLILCVW